MFEVTTTLRKCLAICDRLGIDYAIMGGFAVRTYGVPRPTFDVDLAISIDRDRLSLLYDEIEQEGFTVAEQFRSGWVDVVGGQPLVRFQLYISNELIDVDMFLAESEFHQQMLRRRVSAELDDNTVYVVTAEDLILMKLVANRPRDIIDIQDIRFMHGQLDEEYMRNWADQLQIRDRLDAVLSKPAM